jgi:hypothetical protein
MFLPVRRAIADFGIKGVFATEEARELTLYGCESNWVGDGSPIGITYVDLALGRCAGLPGA